MWRWHACATSNKSQNFGPRTERKGRRGRLFSFVAFENFLHTGEAIKFPDSTDIECNWLCYRTIRTSILLADHRGSVQNSTFNAVLTNWLELESDIGVLLTICHKTAIHCGRVQSQFLFFFPATVPACGNRKERPIFV